ncbi:hypothetical protein OCL45_08600 [Neisseria gonorrhoeae]|nr:hypothetical protein OCL45_08600 [Neisseria gonorrhoeae]
MPERPMRFSSASRIASRRSVSAYAAISSAASSFRQAGSPSTRRAKRFFAAYPPCSAHCLRSTPRRRRKPQEIRRVPQSHIRTPQKSVVGISP